MKRMNPAILVTMTMACLLLAAPATAAEADMYVFGTRLILTSPRQLTDPNTGWWAELLPMEYNYATGTIIKTVNAARAARGLSTMVDVKSYPISLGGEMPVENGYEYNIDFARMSPEDIAVVLENFPLTGVLSDVTQELRPVGVGFFYANSTAANASVNLELLGQTLTFTDSDNFNSARDKVAAVLAAQFGDRAKFSLSFNRYSNVDSTGSFDVNVTVYLDGAEASMGYGGPIDSEGGM